MKKISLALGTIGAAFIPIVTVISCSPNAPKWQQLDLNKNAQTISALKSGDSEIQEITKIEVIYDKEKNAQGLGTIGFGLAGNYSNNENFAFKFCVNINSVDTNPNSPKIDGSIWWTIDNQPKVEISMQNLIENKISPKQIKAIEILGNYLAIIFQGLDIDNIFASFA